QHHDPSYDKDGYDGDGFHRDTGFDREGFTRQGYDYRGRDRSGKQMLHTKETPSHASSPGAGGRGRGFRPAMRGRGRGRGQGRGGGHFGGHMDQVEQLDAEIQALDLDDEWIEEDRAARQELGLNNAAEFGQENGEEGFDFDQEDDVEADDDLAVVGDVDGEPGWGPRPRSAAPNGVDQDLAASGEGVETAHPAGGGGADEDETAFLPPPKISTGGFIRGVHALQPPYQLTFEEYMQDKSPALQDLLGRRLITVLNWAEHSPAECDHDWQIREGETSVCELCAWIARQFCMECSKCGFCVCRDCSVDFRNRLEWTVPGTYTQPSFPFVGMFFLDRMFGEVHDEGDRECLCEQHGEPGGQEKNNMDEVAEDQCGDFDDEQ
ncbi:hypothetical protein LTS18_012408, partial [Coniosporium uncinatum]